MANLDVDLLFTNIPLDETIFICIDSLYNDNENTPKIPKDVFWNFLCLTRNSIKNDGVAMGSLLSPADNFMCSFEHKWLKDCPYGLRPVFYRQNYMNSLDYCDSNAQLFFQERITV